jgi:hypothetical protein
MVLVTKLSAVVCVNLSYKQIQNCMKNILLLICFVIPVHSFSQFHLAAFNKAVTGSLARIIEEFPNHFNTIRGAVISRDVQSVNYACTINLEGADSSIIIQNGESDDSVFSWQQIVFEGENFDDAKKQFHAYYNKIKGTTVNIDSKKISFEAGYTSPTDTKRFASIIFTANQQTEELKNVVIDLNLQYIISGWQITINVYEHSDYGVDEN